MSPHSQRASRCTACQHEWLGRGAGPHGNLCPLPGCPGEQADTATVCASIARALQEADAFTLELDVPPDVHRAVLRAATRAQVSVHEYARRALHARLRADGLL